MNLLVSALRQPDSVSTLSPGDWDLLIRQARHANLLGRLGEILAAPALDSCVPERPRNHLRSAATVARQQRFAVLREAAMLRDVLAEAGIPLVLLKGAAYVATGLPAARGRVFSDIDILVPRSALGQAESALMLNGWMSDVEDAYDQRYYRQWMHELPALRHIYRGSALDVHHTILPPTARLKPDPRLLLEASQEVPGLPGIRSLCLEDLILHSACHLFHEGEADNLLRDLSDLDLLLRHLDAQPGRWDTLIERSHQLQLNGPLRLALRYSHSLLATPVPSRILGALTCLETRGLQQRILDAIYSRVLRPQHASTRDMLTPAARRLLYLRGHWLRMPPHLLAYHLTRKALFPPKTRSLNKDAAAPPAAGQAWK